MKTIRQGTFETNSSSCHTMTITTSDIALKEFNEGKRIYANLKHSNAYSSLGRAFHTFHDIAEALIETIDSASFDNIQNDSVHNSLYNADYIIYSESPYSDEAEAEIDDLKEWVKNNFNEEILEWAFTNKKIPGLIPVKPIIRNFIRAWADEICIGPILTIKDFRNGCGRADFYKMDGSDVYWNNELGEMVAYDFDGIDSNNLRLRFDFRD